jgi:hypothetical protein
MITRVRDIAQVELAARDYTVNSGLGGKPRLRCHFPAPGLNDRHVRRGSEEDG